MGGVAPGGRWGMRVERSVAAIPFGGAVRAPGVVARWGRVGTGSSRGWRPGLECPEPMKKGEPPPPDRMIQGQVAADTLDWNIRGGSSSRSRRPPDRSILGQKAEDAPDWIVRGRTRRSGHNLQDMIIWAQVARHPWQDRPGKNKQQQPPPPGQVRKQHKEQPRGGTGTQGRRRG